MTGDGAYMDRFGYNDTEFPVTKYDHAWAKNWSGNVGLNV